MHRTIVFGIAVVIALSTSAEAQTPREIMPRSPNYFGGGDTTPRAPSGQRLAPPAEIEDALR